MSLIVRTTIQPETDMEIDESEYLNLRNQGLLLPEYADLEVEG